MGMHPAFLRGLYQPELRTRRCSQTSTNCGAIPCVLQMVQDRWFLIMMATSNRVRFMMCLSISGLGFHIAALDTIRTRLVRDRHAFHTSTTRYHLMSFDLLRKTACVRGTRREFVRIHSRGSHDRSCSLNMIFLFRCDDMFVWHCTPRPLTQLA